jgi:hypothetical protein
MIIIEKRRRERGDGMVGKNWLSWSSWLSLLKSTRANVSSGGENLKPEGELMVEEGEEGEPPPLLPIPLTDTPLPFEQLLRQCAFKDTFQLYRDTSSERLYILLRSTSGHEQCLEGRVPVIALDEKRLLQLITMLQQSLREIQEEAACHQDQCWPATSLDPNQPVTSQSTTLRDSYTNIPLWFLEEMYHDDYLPDHLEDRDDERYENEREEDEDFETDDGISYSSSS